MRIRKADLVVLVIVILVSLVVHMPIETQQLVFNKVVVSEPLYTDVISEYKALYVQACNEIEQSKDWINRDKLLAICKGELDIPLPYIDYSYRHAPLAGFTWTILTALTLIIVYPQWNIGSPYAITVFYLLYTAIIVSVLLLAYRRLASLYQLLGVEWPLLYILPVVSPSLIVYSIYSWEPLLLLFLLEFLYWILVEEYKKAVVFLGLCALTNSIGFALVFLILYLYTVGSKLAKLDSICMLLLAFILSPYIVLGVVNTQGTINIVLPVMHEFCNNCIYLLLTGDPVSQMTKAVSVAVWITVITIYLSLKPRVSDKLSKYSYFILFLGFASTLSLTYPPQSILYILPLLPPLYLAYTSTKPIIPHILIDALNSLIITTWFKDLELRRAFSFLGLKLEYNPWALESPVQWIAQTRNIVLLVVLIIYAMEYLELIVSEER